MNELKTKVQALRDKQDDGKSIAKMSYHLCKTFGWDFYTLQEQPIPFILDMANMMAEEAREQNSKVKHGR